VIALFSRTRKFFPTATIGALLLIGSIASGCPSSWAQPVEIIDDLGRKITLSQPAHRIIPLYGAFGEIVFSIGAGSRLIARTQADNSIPEASLLPSVGTHMRPNVEMIIGLKPDLVVMSASRREETPEISRVLDSGIPVAVFAPKTFEDIFSVVERLGILCGNPTEASEFTGKLRRRLEEVRARLNGIGEKRKVFFEIRAEPLTGAGRGSIVQDVLAAAGGENVLKNEKAIVRYNVEALLFEDPDFYIVQEGPMNKSPTHPQKRPHFDRLKCVREGRIIFADEFIFSRPGPRCIEAVERLAAALYPERFQK
jgi:iron complex transport system substrate-binding protein